jgi:three-Cys-motif partner protein
MHPYLLPQEDGLPMRPSGPWVAEKLHYLERYINVFETSMRNKPWRRRNYIDLFAGPGKCVVNQGDSIHLGSPLLALTTPHPFTDYFFVDLGEDNIGVLEQRCSASSISDRVHCFVGDSNVIVRGIARRIQAIDDEYIPEAWPSLNLAFLDPDGLELQWGTVASLAEMNRMDLIIHYSQGGLNRSMPKAYQSEEETAVDRFFGGPEWRQVYEKHGNNHRLLMDHYKERLQDLGYEETLRDDEIDDEPLIRNASRGAPLYRLLFASKHPLGRGFWHAVTRRDVYGQEHLL